MYPFSGSNFPVGLFNYFSFDSYQAPRICQALSSKLEKDKLDTLSYAYEYDIIDEMD